MILIIKYFILAVARFSITLAKGDPNITTEQPATLIGFKKEIDSTEWLVDRVVHNLSNSGLTTDIEFLLKIE